MRREREREGINLGRSKYVWTVDIADGYRHLLGTQKFVASDVRRRL